MRHSGTKWLSLSPLHPIAGHPPAKARACPQRGDSCSWGCLGEVPQGSLLPTLPAAGSQSFWKEALMQDRGRMGGCAFPRPPQTRMKNLKQTCNNFSTGFRDCQMMAQRPNLAGCLFWKLLYWDTAWLVFLFSVYCL